MYQLLPMCQVFIFAILFNLHNHFMVSYYYSHFTEKEAKARETDLSKITELVSGRTEIQLFVCLVRSSDCALNTALYCLTHRT